MSGQRHQGPRADAPAVGPASSSRRGAAAGKATITQRLAAPAHVTGDGAPPRPIPPDRCTAPIAASAPADLDDPFGFHLAHAAPHAIDGATAQAVAASGVAGPAHALPHGERIQASFGRHDLSAVRAHVGGAAGEAAAQIGATAYATGSDIAFAGTPDLHAAAHEAAHVVQQRGGVQLDGGVGQDDDIYEQHADAVADRVVRGESAESLLDQFGTAAGSTDSSRGRSSSLVQRQRTGARHHPPDADHPTAHTPADALPTVTAATELDAVAKDVIEAAGLVSLIGATRRFNDGAVNRLQAALTSLGDVAFRDARPQAGDAAALEAALAAARAAADALGVMGRGNRHELALRKAIGTIERQARASTTRPAAAAPTLAAQAGQTLAHLEHARALAAPFPQVDHTGLAAAIAETTTWHDALVGQGAAAAADRLGVVVPFQHDLVRSAAKELARALRDPAVADHGHVVAAFVRAMANAADPATGPAVLAWARSERDRQVLRTAEHALDGASADVATLASAKIDARRGQRGLERRIDQLDARLIAGGAVDDLVLRETQVAARAHAFVTAMQALEVQTLQLAEACAAANDSLIAQAANHWHAKIKKLPGELRELAKVPQTYRNEYRHRTAAALQAHDADDGADARAERKATLATRAAALDAIEPEARAWAAAGYLQERLKFAETELRDAQIRTLVWTLAATVAQVVAGTFVSAAVGYGAEVAMVGRGAMATELAVGAATAATDIGLNTAFQQGVLGDHASLLTIAGVNAANLAVSHLIEAGFQGLSSVEAAEARNAERWGRLASGAERMVASARMDRLVRLGEDAAVFGTTLSAQLIAGAAVDYAVRKAAGGRATAPGDLSPEDWLLQGAAMGLGRFIAARLRPLAERSFGPLRARALAGRATALVSRARTVADTGGIEAANALLIDYHALLDVERIQLEAAIAEGLPAKAHASADLDAAEAGVPSREPASVQGDAQHGDDGSHDQETAGADRDAAAPTLTYLDSGATAKVSTDPTAESGSALPAGPAARTSGRIEAPVAGLYDGIDFDHQIAGWTFDDGPFEPDPDYLGYFRVETTITGPSKDGNGTASGWMERSYNPATDTLLMKNAFLDKLANKIDHPGVTMLGPGRGTPLVTYLTMRQMKLLGVDYGTARTVKMTTIQNVKAVIELAYLMKKGLTADEAIVKTHSYQYGTTAIVQSGMTVVRARVGGDTQPKRLGDLLDWFESGSGGRRRDVEVVARHEAMLRDVGKGRVDREDDVLWNYDIVIDVKPFEVSP